MFSSLDIPCITNFSEMELSLLEKSSAISSGIDAEIVSVLQLKASLYNNALVRVAHSFKVGLCQLSVSPDKNQNVICAHNLIKVAAEQGARLVVLPDFGNGDLSPSFSMLSEVASCYRITIVGGSIPELCNGWLYNTCCVFGSDGKLKDKHRKIHLFDIDVSGDISYKESDFFAAEMNLQLWTQLAMLYRAKGAHLICYPGAFNMNTGELLWELVQQARLFYKLYTAVAIAIVAILSLIWLKSITNLPVQIKGVLTHEDGKEKFQFSLMEECGGERIFSRQDVLVRRPIIYGLAAKGEYGVRRVLEMLKDELELTMALSGCSSLKEIPRSHVTTKHDKQLLSML
ncbi:FMN-dependent dehydrogenase [Corchorus olitorius]|uniref:FMN-dependent dehydrogenase n=1 Tax=Corchorus olitorius TaxID=93759 RepID=A0A1R3L4B9_9ROSI|nr:FMN-dependent dehydrogenase [Corchorus olitorius]